MVRSTDVILILVAMLFPPAAAAIVTGCGCDFLINLLLTILGYIPGLLHSFWLIYKKMQAEERFGNSGFRYVGNGHFEPLYQGANQPQQQAPYYGSTRR
ncbi:UPF0057-domain-containing protein [Collybia nuda]|uniref:UPF0057-domain-containing protein n=1 Tax=Collybia nuda TaxID=64659 RepID=A0A9P6CDA2_9AGAR|nr:UPF0057-domain-containing protein [Collybia nuda]